MPKADPGQCLAKLLKVITMLEDGTTELEEGGQNRDEWSSRRRHIVSHYTVIAFERGDPPRVSRVSEPARRPTRLEHLIASELNRREEELLTAEQKGRSSGWQ